MRYLSWILFISILLLAKAAGGVVWAFILKRFKTDEFIYTSSGEKIEEFPY